MYWSTPPGDGRWRVVDGPRSEPGNRVKMSNWLSPSSVAMAATYTSAFTLGAPNRRVRDHHAAVRVPDEHDRRRDGRGHALEVVRVRADTAERVRGSDDGGPRTPQAACDAVPAARVGEGAVLDDDRGPAGGAGATRTAHEHLG